MCACLHAANHNPQYSYNRLVPNVMTPTTISSSTVAVKTSIRQAHHFISRFNNNYWLQKTQIASFSWMNSNVSMSVRHLVHILIDSSTKHVTWRSAGQGQGWGQNWVDLPCPLQELPQLTYFGETGRKFGLRMKEHKIEMDSFTAGTQTWASRARETSKIHK